LRALVEPFERILAGLAAAPETVIHADLHLDNVIFVTAAGGFQAKIIDWQSPSRGAAMLDVAGFIAESLSVDDRRADETELLRGYHRGLLDAGVKQYGFDRLYADYRRALCVRCAGQVGWLARVSANAPSGRERALVDALVDPGNVFAALLDHAPALGLGRS
jgi:aminoglycoside phosphotransferase (APT) family kinase protein